MDHPASSPARTTRAAADPGEDAPTAVPALVAGRFEVGPELGRGAMGLVHRAHDRLTGRAVALKLPRGRGEAAGVHVATETRALARLDHPRVVWLVASGDGPEGPWLATELVPGALTLTQALVLAPRAERLRWVLDAAAGLGHAHARGVLHRDVKPDNILVGADGRARLADFGLAQVEGAPETAARPRAGTPCVLAPERVLGGPATTASDVWGLGCTLHVALVDCFPFEKDDLHDLCRAILRTPPAGPRALDPTVPPGLDALVLDALARDPWRRPADGAAFARRLVRALKADEGLAGRSGRDGRQDSAGSSLTSPRHRTSASEASSCLRSEAVNEKRAQRASGSQPLRGGAGLVGAPRPGARQDVPA